MPLQRVMAGLEDLDLAATIQRYGEVAEAVNRREMKRFVEEVRHKWDPDPPEEWERRGEGYTDEGALALCIYHLAFEDDPIREGQLCEAEELDQVLLRPLIDDFADEIEKPIEQLPTQPEIEQQISLLKGQLQRQVQEAGTMNAADIHLPHDFIHLMSITNGIYGAGVPAETSFAHLVYNIRDHHADLGMLQDISHWATSCFCKALAAWEVGSCRQHRQIWYVFCYRTERNSSTVPAWRILDRDDVDSDVYDTLAQFLQREIESVKKRAQREYITYLPKYP